VDFLSTVSGGSIIGAYWVYCQSKKDIANDNEAWNRFETTLIEIMQGGIRGRILWRGFAMPVLILGVVAAIVTRLVWPGRLDVIAYIAVVILVTAYMIWHYSGTYLLAKQYDNLMFQRARVADIGYGPPAIFINATGLNFGEHLYFGAGHPDIPEWSYLWQAYRHTMRPERPLAQPRDSSLAYAVAGSSAIPLVFTPLVLSVRKLWKLHYNMLPVKPNQANLSIVDGGVLDNQGIEILLSEKCQCASMIVSDASAVIQYRPKHSTWQLLPSPGRGVIYRAQEIIYSRARDLGYKLLEAEHKFFRLIQELSSSNERRGQLAQKCGFSLVPSLSGYAYVELLPEAGRYFKWISGLQRLPEDLIPLLATIRTDLDRFSAKEISVLMFHGYTTIDHCLRSYNPAWVPTPPALKFSYPGRGMFSDWNRISQKEIRRAEQHLAASGSRFFLWRVFQRIFKTSCSAIFPFREKKQGSE
jgi:hypothetical protein